MNTTDLKEQKLKQWLLYEQYIFNYAIEYRGYIIEVYRRIDLNYYDAIAWLNEEIKDLTIVSETQYQAVKLMMYRIDFELCDDFISAATDSFFENIDDIDIY